MGSQVPAGGLGHRSKGRPGGLRYEGRFRILLVIFAVLSLPPAYLHAYKIVGASEIPTVLVGDTILVNSAAWRLKLPYTNVPLFRTGTPQRGDFACLSLPNHPQLNHTFFKRILGLPGETVELRENRVFVNGRPLPVTPLDPATFAWVPRTHPIGSSVESEDGHWITFTPGKNEHRNHPATHLGPREYFLLGENRDDSVDSREFGPVSDDLFLGKVVAAFPSRR